MIDFISYLSMQRLAFRHILIRLNITLSIYMRLDILFYLKTSRFNSSYFFCFRASVSCKEPIEVVSYKIGVCKVSSNGKECQTDFQRLSYNGKTSVVLCHPRTGRMHQIRVHLQYLGNDIIIPNTIRCILRSFNHCM